MLILLFVISGAVFLMSTNDLVSIFLSIELQSYGCAPDEASVIEVLSELYYALSDIIGMISIIYLSRVLASWLANNDQEGIAEYKNLDTNSATNLDIEVSEGDHGQVNKLDTYREALLGQKAQCSYSRLSWGKLKFFVGRPYNLDCQKPKAHCNTADQNTQGPKVITNVNRLQLRDLTAYALSIQSTRGRSFHSTTYRKGSSHNVPFLPNQVSNMEDSIKPNLNGGKMNESISTWLKTEVDKYLKGDGKYNGIVNIISDEDFLKFCYLSIKSNPGNMSEGAKRITLDGINEKWFSRASKDILSGKFDFTPTRRVMIPKPGKTETRPLSVGNPREKIIQKAILLVLEQIWEDDFSNNSYGFRANKTLHQALHHLYYNGSPYHWVIQGEISKCFDRIPHQIILDCLAKKVKCEKTINLIRKLISAGHRDPKSGNWIKGKVGTPQGSIISPILANIVLNEFDKYMDSLKLNFEKGKKRIRNKEYDALTSKIAWLKKSKPGSPLIKELAIKRREIPSLNMFDPNFKRLMYLRYADDFVILIIGSLDEAKMIKQRITDVLKKRCGLELNQDKTLITATKEGFTFLGANCSKTTAMSSGLFTNKKGNPAKSRMRLRIEAPITKLLDKLRINKFTKRDAKGLYQATSRRDLINFSHWEILSFYNSRILGILNFYSFAANYNGLRSIVMYLQQSCALTLALKYKLRTKRQAFTKFGRTLEDPDTGTKLITPTDFKVKHKYSGVEQPKLDNILKKSWYRKVTKSVLNAECTVCQSKANVEMHHIRKVKDVRHLIKTGNSTFE